MIALVMALIIRKKKKKIKVYKEPSLMEFQTADMKYCVSDLSGLERKEPN